MDSRKGAIHLSPRLFSATGDLDSPPPRAAKHDEAPHLESRLDETAQLEPQQPVAAALRYAAAGLLSPITATFLRASGAGNNGFVARPTGTVATTLGHIAPAMIEKDSFFPSLDVPSFLHPGVKALSPSGPPQLWEPTGVRLSDVPDAELYPTTVETSVTGLRRRHPHPNRPQLGLKLRVGGVEVALFRYRNTPIIVSALCPHLKADLSLGDIEELGGSLCVTCPAHHFMYDTRTGACMMPAGRKEYQLRVFYARADAHGFVEVGFSRLEAAAFGQDYE